MIARNGILMKFVAVAPLLVSGCLFLRPEPEQVSKHVASLPGIPKPRKDIRGTSSPYHPESELVEKPRGDIKGAHEKVARRQEPSQLVPGIEKEQPSAGAWAAKMRPTTPCDLPRGVARPIVPPLPPPAVGPEDEPTVVALRAYLQKRAPEALRALHEFDKPTQDMLLVALPMLARLSEGDVENLAPGDAGALVEGLRSLEMALRHRAALEIEQFKLCKDIHGFGQIQLRDEGNEFESGTRDCARLYVELANVTSHRNGPWYESRLQAQLEIRDFHGKEVYTLNSKIAVDRSLSPKHDYFLNYEFWIPAEKLPPGRYTLQVLVRDLTGVATKDGKGMSPEELDVPAHRMAIATLDFKVTGPNRSGNYAARPTSPVIR